MQKHLRTLALSALWLGAPTTLWAESITLRSDLPGYEASLLSSLPAAPTEREHECRTAPAQSPSGKVVEAAGWRVVGEATLGDAVLVSFAGGSSPGPEGVCELTDVNLGVFDGDRLVGLFWTRGDGAEAFGGLRTDRKGAVGVSNSSFPVIPIAEVVRNGGEVVLQPYPALLPGCGDKVQVPQLWGQPIGKMREAILAAGWLPETPTAADPISSDMQARGFPETESCSGTGANYCSYDYANTQAKLRLISVGELGDSYQPIAADYELTCQEGSR